MPRPVSLKPVALLYKGKSQFPAGPQRLSLPLASGMVPNTFLFLRERRWLQAGLIFQVTTGKVWTSAFSRLQRACPPPQPTSWSAGLDRYAELRVGPGLADQKDEIASVSTGDLRHTERGRATITTAQLFLPPSLSQLSFPLTCTVSALLTTAYITFQLVPFLCPPPTSTQHKATSGITLKRSAALLPPCHLLDKNPGIPIPTVFP